MRVAVRIVTALIAVFFVSLGVWALTDPRSFYDQLAAYPPYNEHFLHDVGAFQIGIGSTLGLALFRRDALQVALLGTSIGTVMHAVSHFMDRDMGRASDPILLSALALLTMIVTAVYLGMRRR